MNNIQGTKTCNIHLNIITVVLTHISIILMKIIFYFQAMFNNSIGGIIVSMLAASVVDRRIESRFGQTTG
jgi:uncharacterized membrane protein YwaF